MSGRRERAILSKVRQCILEIDTQYGLGYPATTVRRLLIAEMECSGLAVWSDVQIQATLNGEQLSRHVGDHLLAADTVLLSVGALTLFPPTYEFARTKTFLNSLGLKLGLVVNFGKKQLQIYGVSPD